MVAVVILGQAMRQSHKIAGLLELGYTDGLSWAGQ